VAEQGGPSTPGSTDPGSTPPRAGATGLGRLLVGLYGVFALAATSRAAVQIATRFEEAPVAYALSALAAVVYLVATVAIARGGRRWHRIAVAACGFELAGVLTIGSMSLLLPSAFPDETVWSTYGQGYLFIPLVLPVLGLAYLRRNPPA
jgi:cytochrome bd-type quinol oxidase subunit 2